MFRFRVSVEADGDVACDKVWIFAVGRRLENVGYAFPQVK
jgi:hypothetical protein